MAGELAAIALLSRRDVELVAVTLEDVDSLVDDYAGDAPDQRREAYRALARLVWQLRAGGELIEVTTMSDREPRFISGDPANG